MEAAGAIAANIAFTTSGSLVDCVDKKVMIALRDGRKFVGVLRSYDQFANLVLSDTFERVFIGNHYGDIPRGIFLVRGENVVLMGEVDLDREDEIPPEIAAPLPQGSIQQLLAAHAAEQEKRAKAEARKAAVLRREKGFCEQGGEGDGY
ncbi:Sm-like ribonucleo protein [Tilletiaria anomala UBC 951]|uniref:U6 snRNA-associated Sm-like protein LSm1 n=1 Tax=Tilletiaria anomala (strain ATCC 24038 / CBS 436.72 / UBC 951) TaxID=1037660 RepID=A0A066WMG7_TILAU|nr:Sm-like ribonucleoprotein [Tilletiaria anomala UBC 951]KDN52199.1 Sm-like ribonucleo protein [Tilletiaria anomala UBC 951]